MSHFQDSLGCTTMTRRKSFLKITSDHERNQLILIRLGNRQRSDVASVLQHRHAITNRKDLLHAMRNVDDRFTFAAETTDNFKKHVRFRRGQESGRFIEDNQARSLPDYFCDRHELLAGHPPPPKQMAWIDRALGPGQKF